MDLRRHPGVRRWSRRNLRRAPSTRSAFEWCTDDEEEREPKHNPPRKVRPSDDDSCHWVGAPDVDTKASAFIAKFHEARFMDLET